MSQDRHSGVYILEIFLEDTARLRIGRLGAYDFPRGYYYYCGSAQNNLQKRLLRHLGRDKKRHWHIDYLLGPGRVTKLYTFHRDKELECTLARGLAKRGLDRLVPGFGSSDCGCLTHLFHGRTRCTDPGCILDGGRDMGPQDVTRQG